jgi:1-phosphofructokinase family hexose kinase
MVNTCNRHVLTVALNAAIDTTLIITTPLISGPAHKAREVFRLPGGGGINVARVLRTLNVPARATSLLGGQAAGFIKHKIEQEGIDISWHNIAGETRSCTTVVEWTSRKVIEINEPGPTVTETEAQAFLSLFETHLSDTCCVVLSGSLPPGIPDNYYAQMIQRANQAGILTLLDTSGNALFEGLKAQPTIIKSNSYEAQHFLGRPLLNIEDAIEAGQHMRQQGAQIAIITLGDKGAILITEVGIWQAHLHLPEAFSTVGCGDAFVAGFVAGILPESTESSADIIKDESRIEQALRQAVACGAANTLCLGAGILSLDDVERLKKEAHLTSLSHHSSLVRKRVRS